MAVLAKVGTLRKRLPSVLIDPCLYYCCTVHQALAALRSLCTEGCARTIRSKCVGVRNVICEFIWTAATVLFTQVQTGFFEVYCTCSYCRVQATCSKPQAACEQNMQLCIVLFTKEGSSFEPSAVHNACDCM